MVWLRGFAKYDQYGHNVHACIGPTYIAYVYIIVIPTSSFKMKHYHSFKFLPCNNSILYFTIKTHYMPGSQTKMYM